MGRPHGRGPEAGNGEVESGKPMGPIPAGRTELWTRPQAYKGMTDRGDVYRYQRVMCKTSEGLSIKHRSAALTASADHAVPHGATRTGRQRPDDREVNT
jgi:hypothetical protein